MKVTGCVSVCLCVPKDLPNHQTDIVILYNVVLNWPWESSLLFFSQVPLKKDIKKEKYKVQKKEAVGRQ